MEDDWVIVFESTRLQLCNERLLVLQSLSIPGEIAHSYASHAVVVPASVVERAKYEIWQYDQENVKPVLAAPLFTPVQHNSVPGIVIYVFIVCIVAWFAG